MQPTLYLTFDIDMANYLAKNPLLDEMQEAVPFIFETLKKHGIAATWFGRIDHKMALDFGAADYIFVQHAAQIKKMKNAGHEFGWHFHSYRKQGGKWKQNTDEIDVVVELQQNYPLAKQHGLKSLRMGWAYHTQQTWNYTSTLGLHYDSSAMPRPNYAWEKSLRNWDTSVQQPFYAQPNNYKQPGGDPCGTLQIPLTTAQISAPTDTEPNMVRLINPMYKHAVFVQTLKQIRQQHIVLVMHPYEVLKLDIKHSLMSFDPAVFEENIAWLVANNYTFDTLHSYSQLIKEQNK